MLTLVGLGRRGRPAGTLSPGWCRLRPSGAFRVGRPLGGGTSALASASCHGLSSRSRRPLGRRRMRKCGSELHVQNGSCRVPWTGESFGRGAPCGPDHRRRLVALGRVSVVVRHQPRASRIPRRGLVQPARHARRTRAETRASKPPSLFLVVLRAVAVIGHGPNPRQSGRSSPVARHS